MVDLLAIVTGKHGMATSLNHGQQNPGRTCTALSLVTKPKATSMIKMAQDPTNGQFRPP